MHVFVSRGRMPGFEQVMPKIYDNVHNKNKY